MLNKATLSQAIKSALLDQRQEEEDPNKAAGDLADKIANAIDSYVKQIQITYTAGLAAPSGGGPVTGLFNYTVS